MEDLREEKLARAIAAHSRRQILRLLAEKELSVSEVAKRLGMSVSLASRHLKFLLDLGILSVKKNYPNKMYTNRIKEVKVLLNIYERVKEKL